MIKTDNTGDEDFKFNFHERLVSTLNEKKVKIVSIMYVTVCEIENLDPVKCNKMNMDYKYNPKYERSRFNKCL